MPDWKKLIVSGSDAVLNTVNASSFTGSLFGTSSFSLRTQRSIESTSSDLLDGLHSSSFASTGSNNFNNSQFISGALVVSQGITGSLFGTSSWASNVISASYVLSSSYAQNTLSSSYAQSALLATSATTAATASFVNTLNQTLNVTALTASGLAETIQQWNVVDNSSFLQVTNATSTNGVFIPYINSVQETSSNNIALLFSGRIGLDSGASAATIFDVRSGSAAVIQNRPLFLWRNYNVNYMTLDSTGSLGIGTITPGAKLHVEGTISGSSINLTRNSIIKGSSATTGNSLELYNSGNSLISYFPNSGGLGTKVIATPATPTADNGVIFIDSIAKILSIKDDTGLYKAYSMNASTGSQGPGFTTDTYITDSDVIIPSWGIQQKTTFLWNVVASKTNAGTATPIYNIRIGTGRTTSDTSRLTLTGPAQTAVVDSGSLWVKVTVNTTGSATVLHGTAWWNHQGTAANTTTQGVGFANNGTGHVSLTSAAFTGSNLGGQYVGLSINGGASAAWTVRQVSVNADW